MKTILILALIGLSFGAMAQNKPVEPPKEKQYYIVFTKIQLDSLTAQMNRATYKLNNSVAPAKEVNPAINLIEQIFNAFWENYNNQVAAENEKAKEVKPVPPKTK